jgi:GNAT superfamily N-acetyltransferase
VELQPRPEFTGTETTVRSELHRLTSEREPAAAAILAAFTSRGTLSAGAALLSTLRADPDSVVYGLTVDDALVAVYALRKTRLSMEMTLLVVAEPLRGRGYGRACLADAMRRAGRWPLVVDADASTWRFFQSAGFRLVSRHRGEDGAMRVRFAWHSRPSPAGTREGQ